MGILIKYIKGNHMEDLILQKYKPKTLRIYPKTSIEVYLEEAAWWGVFVSKFFIKMNNYHPWGMDFYPWNLSHQEAQLSRCFSKFSKVNCPISWFYHEFLHKWFQNIELWSNWCCTDDFNLNYLWTHVNWWTVVFDYNVGYLILS